jgi:phage shock protein PspC (stress-responsive transcriptional regulator)
MNTTININLGGFFFHIDEDAYLKLSRYFEAVKQSLAPDGKEEIMKDIESRIAELFQARIKNEKQVVILEDIDYVIGIMGQPEDYAIHDRSEPKTNAQSGTNFNSNLQSKKLYRDKENAIVSGVAAGFGHYFNIDPVWIRLAFVVLVIAGLGSPVLLYFILIVIIPEATSTAQKLEMKGEPITISNIERKVREGIDDITDKFKNIDTQKFTEQTKHGVDKIGSSISEMITILFKIFGKFIGGILFLIGTIALFGILITASTMIFSATMPETFIFKYIHTPIGLETPLWIQGILFLFAFGIPFFFVMLLGLKLLITNLKSIGYVAKYTLLAFWIMAVIALIGIGINEATKYAFEGKTIQKEYLTVSKTDTLKIKFIGNDMFFRNRHSNRKFTIVTDEKGTDILYSNDISFEIMPTDEATAYLQIEKLANGKNYLEAKKTAEKINYHFKMDKNQLILDDYFVSDIRNKFRGQEILIYLYLPKGTFFKTDKSVETFDYSDNDFFNLHYSSSNYIYKVEAEKVKCLNCEETENENNASDSHEDNASTTIIFDKNGIKIKDNIEQDEL